MEVIVGYILAVLVGISLGLVGSGGSILTVPILVYVFHIEPILATTYSLFIVGITALIGGIRNIQQKNVDIKAVVLFGISSIVSVILVRKFFLPIIPDTIFQIHGFVLSKSTLILLLFAILMVAASISMIKPYTKSTSLSPNKTNLFVLGIIIGSVTGILGAGGGFLIIPALILFANLDMKKAVGTSLILIALNALIGFLGSIEMIQHFDFNFLFLFSGLAVVGMFFGIYLSNKIDGSKLKTSFGWLILIMGIYIIVQELFF
ncbi:MAG: sulfite exporter TauE/SafE family protein [Chitinophagales bacterium]